MCNRIIVLARLDHRRWLSCCEHGTTHFTWDSVSLRLHTYRLSTMGKALQECAQVASRFGIASTDDICVVFDQFELYQVWLGGVGLCLSQKDFQLFCQLISEACKHPIVLSTNEGDHSSHPESPQPESPIRTTYHLFSIN